MTTDDETDWVVRSVAAAPPIRPPLAPGEVLGDRFVIERLAGLGGMGAVYRATDRSNGAPLAVKILQGRSAEVDRFAQEARLLAELQHPAVVRYVAQGKLADGQLFLAMEWLDGETLAERLEREPLGAGDAIVTIRRAAEGLALVHQHGIVHRDVKPSNLFLVDKNPRQLKLLDFGIARFQLSPRAMTNTGAVLGTVGYMAPEQAIGARDIDARADVFALGCVLFECLTGKPPFAGDHAVAILAKVLREEAPRVSELRPGVQAALDDLVARMLAKDKQLRPKDATALLAEIDRFSTVAEETPLSSARYRARLTGSEQRLACVILVQLDGSAVSMAETLSPDKQAHDLADTRGLAAPFGAEVEQLADGTLLLTLSAHGSANDQASRASSLALALRGANPGARVALATGRGGTNGGQAFGPAIDRAAALLDSSPGIVRIDEVTAGLLDARFDVRGGVLLARREHDGVRTLLGKPTMCVGRDKELVLLEATLTECIDEQVARAILVTAPPGTGKSRLRFELVERARKRGDVTILIARADPVAAGSSLGLVRQLARAGMGLREGDPAREQQQRLAAHLSSHLSGHFRNEGLARMCEFLGELVGVPSDAASPLLRAARNDPEMMGVWMRRSFEDWLLALCVARPLLIVLEDLHWGDAPSLAYVEGLLRKLDERALFVLALARPEVHEIFPKLWSSVGAQEIRLPGLPRRAAERLVRSVLGDDVGRERVSRIVERADGNAYYLEELIRRVAETDTDQLPETILAMVESRLARLEPDARRILRAASVFGEVFWEGGVTALLGGEDHANEVAGWLRALVGRELLTTRMGEKFPGDHEYAFRHGLLRDAAYATLTDADRLTAHRLAGEWLEHAGEKDALVLADHFEQGGEPIHAIPLLLRAGQIALAAGKPDAALTLARRGFSVGASGGDLAGFQALECQAHAQLTDWHQVLESGSKALKLVPASSPSWFTVAGGMSWGATVLSDPAPALEIMRAVATAPSLPEATGPYGYTMYILIGGLVQFGQRELALSCLRQFEEVARASGEQDPVFAGWLRVVRFQVLEYVHDDPARAKKQISEALRLFEGTSERGLLSAEFSRAQTLMEVGSFVECETLLRQHLPEWGRKVISLAACGDAILSWCLSCMGSLEEAREIAASRINDGNFLASCMARNALASCEFLAGRLDDAEHMLRTLVESASRLRLVQSAALATLMRIALARERWSEALALADRFTELKQSATVPVAKSQARLCRAVALDALGQPDAARVALIEARDRILRIAAGFDEPAYRESYLTNVEANARTLALAREWKVP
jgi:predicted Ser/Thr protein kinase